VTLALGPFERARIEEQRRLFALCFPEAADRISATAGHYQWKYERFPADGVCEYVAEDQQELVGYYAALPYRYLHQDRRLVGGLVCDVMTHPGRRGQGIFTKLGRFATDSLAAHGVDFVTGYPIRAPVIPGHVRVGWRVAFKLPMYVRLLNVEHVFAEGWRRRLARLLGPGLRSYGALCEAVLLRAKRSAAVTASSERQAWLESDEYRQFIAAWTSQQTLALCKDAQFMKWRLGAPEARCVITVVRQEGVPAAVAVARPEVLRGIPVLAVLDVMFLTTGGGGVAPAVLECMHRMLRIKCEELRLEGIVAMISARLARRYGFLRAGFLRTPFVFRFIYKPLSSRVDDRLLGDESNWHLTWIDSDH